jgi:6,7-dimethyl-8-ribityllumazine synthase
MSTNLTRRAAPIVDGAGRRVALVCARFNDVIVDRLEAGARRSLEAAGVDPTDIEVIRVPGALEAPSAVLAAVRSGRFDAVVALGVVLRGDTYHFEVVSNESASGIMRVALDTGAAITNGILTVDTVEQAMERSGDDGGNKGADAAAAALEMCAVLAALAPGTPTPAFGGDAPPS